MKRLLTITLLLACVLTIGAQRTVTGVVKDRQTGQALAHVSISAEGENAHTVSNEEGRFTLKVSSSPRYIQLSHIGYKTRRQTLSDHDGDMQIGMARNTVALDEVVVTLEDPQTIVRAAMRRIADNYPKEAETVRCFYRETARKGSRYISVAEAVVDMYKTAYSMGPERDAVGILKGRRLMSMKARDTLGVKMQGGPVTPLMADVAKNPEYLLNADMLGWYDYYLEVPVRIDDQLHYVVSMAPKADAPTPLMGGRLFISQQSLAIARAELQLDVSDWRRASQYMLVRKPRGLRFRPKRLTLTAVYQTDQHGVTRLSYMRNEISFKCEWKRRLFASPYTTVSEMVVTERLKQGSEAKRPRGRSTFGQHERFYDKVEFFNDPDFWADYNIIEPTESLENAISKLKKKKLRGR